MYYFIVNPASGSNRGRSVWKSVKKKLDQAGAAYRSFLLSDREKHARLPLHWLHPVSLPSSLSSAATVRSMKS